MNRKIKEQIDLISLPTNELKNQNYWIKLQS